MPRSISLRDVVNLLIDNPLAAMLTSCDVLRSAHQQEPATFEGCCASALMWTKIYGRPTRESIEEWLDELGEVADRPIPVNLLMMCCIASAKER